MSTAPPRASVGNETAATENDLLPLAVRALAGVCDGAEKRDGVGYNGADTGIGHRLAAKPAALWTPGERYFIYHRIGKYRKQLAGYGIDYAEIPVPAKPAAPTQTVPQPPGWTWHFPWIPGVEFRVGRDAHGLPRVFYGEQVAILHWSPEYGMESGARQADFENRKVWAWLALSEPENAAPRIVARPAPKPPAAALNGKALTLKWGFDHPNFDQIKERVKAIGAKWNRDAKVWEIIPTSVNVEPLMDCFAEYGFDLDPTAGAFLDLQVEEWADALERSRAEEAQDFTITTCNPALTPYPFQVAGVREMVKRKRLLLADDMGLGKTPQATLAASETGGWPVLVICPASLKSNWKKEILRWVKTGGAGFGRKEPIIQIADGTKTVGVAEPLDVLIINYDILGAWAETIFSVGFQTVIVDEAHYCKSGKAQRTKLTTSIVRSIEQRYLLTGTPILNKPIELWPLIVMLGHEDTFGGFWKFAKTYCGGGTSWGGGIDTSGASNLDALNEVLRTAGVMVRRRKVDVLKELPPRSWATVPVTLGPAERKRYDAAEADLMGYIAETKALNKKAVEADRAEADLLGLQGKDRVAFLTERASQRYNSVDQNDRRDEQLRRFNYLRQLAVELRMPACHDFIDRLLEAGEKVVIFCHHREVAASLAARYDNAPVIVGGSKRESIEAGKERFQTDPNTRVIVCNIAAGGVGHTLTAASNVVFVEFGWNPAAMNQALDRAHRIGQDKPVTGWRIVAEDTIDGDFIHIIESKAVVVDEAQDGDKETQKGVMAELQRRMDQRIAGGKA